MKQVDKLLRQAVPVARAGGVSAVQEKAPPPYRKTAAAAPSRAGHDHVDAINQAFAELELAYHNQFHKAFAQEGSLALAKKYWLGCLSDFAPEVILRAVRQVVKSQEFLPTVAAVVSACQNAPALCGLPAAEAAYLEACRATPPRQAHAWSHPAVYHAAAQTGWFELESLPQSEIFPLFRYHYELLGQRVLRGETLEIAAPTPLPARSAVPLSAQQNRERLQQLRKRFDL